MGRAGRADVAGHADLNRQHRVDLRASTGQQRARAYRHAIDVVGRYLSAHARRFPRVHGEPGRSHWTTALADVRRAGFWYCLADRGLQPQSDGADGCPSVTRVLWSNADVFVDLS